jgi:hypothetical protein
VNFCDSFVQANAAVKLRAKEMGGRGGLLVESQTVIVIVMMVMVMVMMIVMVMMMRLAMTPHQTEFSVVSGDFDRPSPTQQVRVLGQRVCHDAANRQCNIVTEWGRYGRSQLQSKYVQAPDVDNR